MKKLLALLFAFVFLILLCFTRLRADGNLLTYWKLDETSAGSTAVDSSGNGYDGTPHNAPSPSTDIPSAITFTDTRSLNFDGTQWISTPDNAAFAMTSATFSVWVKFTNISAGDMNMIAKRSSDGSQVQWQFGYNASGNQFKVSLANGGNSCCTDFNWSPSPSLSANTWYNIAITIDQVNHRLTWYQDGTSKKTDDISGHNLGTRITGTDLTLGASYNGTGELLQGRLDDVRMYNTALSGSEISDIAAGNSGPGVSTPTPTSPPTPTATLTPTPTFAPSNANSSCENDAPQVAPDLFQVSTSPTSATLYFTPVSPATGYIVNYGTDTTGSQFATSFDYTNGGGAISYTINALDEAKTYYFKVQAKNNCVAGPWSQIRQGTTTKFEPTGTENAPESPTPEEKPKGTITVTEKTQTVKDKEPIPTPGQGYDLAITVSEDGKPVEGASVEVHSTPMRTTTDKDGIARFTGLEKGDHTVFLAYEGYEGQEHVTLDGDKKDVAITMKVEFSPNGKTFFSQHAIIVIAFLILIICILFLLLWKKRKKQ